MKQNKLGNYLTSFSDKDWASYHKFSKSTYSDTSDYQLVINYIKKHKSRYEPDHMDVEYLRKKIRPTASKQVFANVISNLCKHIEKFLVWVEVENDSMIEDTLLLQALGKRGLTEQFYKQKEKSKIKRDSLPIGLWHNYHDFMAEYLLYFCNMTSDIKVSKIALDNSYQELKKFVAAMTHYISLEMQNRNVLLQENWDKQLNNFTKKYKINHDLELIIDQLIEMKVNKTITSYEYLLREVENSELSSEIRYTILIHLRSFISHKTIRGDNTHRYKLIELQKYGLANDILFPSGKIPAPRFINIIHRACDMKDYKWAIEFINQYSNLVPNTNPKSIKTLGLAQIESSKGNFESVLMLLANTKYNIFEQEMRAKWLILCANYELNKDNYSIIESNITNFRYFIKRNKKNTTQLTVESLSNMTKYLLSIAKGKRLDITLKQVTEEKNLFFRIWLRTKILEKMK